MGELFIQLTAFL